MIAWPCDWQRATIGGDKPNDHEPTLAEGTTGKPTWKLKRTCPNCGARLTWSDQNKPVWTEQQGRIVTACPCCNGVIYRSLSEAPTDQEFRDQINRLLTVGEELRNTAAEIDDPAAQERVQEVIDQWDP